MARLSTFTFRVDKSEKAMLSQLAVYLQRTEGDTVRLLIREAIRQIDHEKNKSIGDKLLGPLQRTP